MSVCLDAWAILAWLDGERPALDRVQAVLDDRPVVSWLNLVEVYYRVERQHGREAADRALADLRRVLETDLPGTARMVEVGRLKAEHPMALGDCFAVATAAHHGRTLITGDPEILGRPNLPCATEDVRTASSTPRTMRRRTRP